MREVGQLRFDGVWDHLRMKHSTAISRLTDVVDGLERAAKWPDATLVARMRSEPSSTAMATLIAYSLALVVAEPADDVALDVATAAPRSARGDTCGFTKLPLSWWWRPEQWAVWNHEIERRSGSGARPTDAIRPCSTRSATAGSTGVEIGRTDEHRRAHRIAVGRTRRRSSPSGDRGGDFPTTSNGVARHRGDGFVQRITFGGGCRLPSISTTPVRRSS